MRSWRTSSIPKGAFWLALAGLTVLAAALSLGLGSVALRDAPEAAQKIMLYIRLPRTCAALLAGSALAVAGAVIQTVLHNPLASSGVLGVNSGAGLAVAVVCAIAPMAQRYTPVIAFFGALAAVMLVVTLAQCTGASRMTVVLAGVAISNIFSAGIDAVVTFVPEALGGVSDYRIGGFSGVTMARIAPAAILIGVSLMIVFSLTRQMDVLALGSETARSLGLSVRPVRFMLLVLAAALSGAAVSFAGLLGFVGLIVPHAMRRFVGGESGPLLAASVLGGACFVTFCDLMARVMFAPFELPVGVVLAVTGGPFFLWLLLRQRGGRA